jgi:hypothetical protein
VASEYSENVVNRIFEIVRVPTYVPERTRAKMRDQLLELVDEIVLGSDAEL